MCERASVRIYLESIAGRFRWRGSGRVSRMLSEVGRCTNLWSFQNPS